MDGEGWLHALRSPVHVVAPDLPGHGQTVVAEKDGYGIPACVATLSRVVESLQFQKFVLIGYSMGGRVALHWASRFPELLAGLVTIGASPGLDEEQERGKRRRWDWDMARRARELGGADFMKEWLDLPILKTRSRMSEPWLTRALERRAQGCGEGWARSLEQAGTGSMEPVWDRLPHIGMPTLLVAGEEDLKYRNLAAKMVQKMPAAKLAVIPGAGHGAHEEAPAAFVDVLLPFLNRVAEDKKKPG